MSVRPVFAFRSLTKALLWTSTAKHQAVPSTFKTPRTSRPSRTSRRSSQLLATSNSHERKPTELLSGQTVQGKEKHCTRVVKHGANLHRLLRLRYVIDERALSPSSQALITTSFNQNVTANSRSKFDSKRRRQPLERALSRASPLQSLLLRYVTN